MLSSILIITMSGERGGKRQREKEKKKQIHVHTYTRTIRVVVCKKGVGPSRRSRRSSLGPDLIGSLVSAALCCRRGCCLPRRLHVYRDRRCAFVHKCEQVTHVGMLRVLVARCEGTGRRGQEKGRGGEEGGGTWCTVGPTNRLVDLSAEPDARVHGP